MDEMWISPLILGEGIVQANLIADIATLKSVIPECQKSIRNKYL